MLVISPVKPKVPALRDCFAALAMTTSVITTERRRADGTTDGQGGVDHRRCGRARDGGGRALRAGRGCSSPDRYRCRRRRKLGSASWRRGRQGSVSSARRGRRDLLEGGRRGGIGAFRQAPYPGQ